METLRDKLIRLGVRNFYGVDLNTAGSRFAVYYHDSETGELEVLWPSDSHEGKKAADRPRALGFSTREGLPAYHFHYTGGGYSKPYSCRMHIAEWLGVPALEVQLSMLRGCSPSRA